MTRPYEGFWQILIPDSPADEIIDYPPMHTTLSLRASGFILYAGGYFIEIRTQKGRRPPASWPPSSAERISFHRTASAFGGRCSWKSDGEWTAAHEIST